MEKPQSMPGTRLILLDGYFLVELTVRGNQPKRARRAVALALFRALKPTLRQIRLIPRKNWIMHEDWASYWFLNDEERGIPLGQALAVDTPEGRLGYGIRIRRLAIGRTQAELARLAGISRTSLISIERGKGVPSPKALIRIEKTLQSLGSPPPDPDIFGHSRKGQGTLPRTSVLRRGAS
jgi:DNA-binding XRE family transcriptional regulator